MRQRSESLAVATRRGLVEITPAVAAAVRVSGDDDMSAHAKAALLKTSEQIPVVDGALALGAWQGLYVWEHRTGSHRRNVAVLVAGE
jgi:secondary thiamine-phosphate synthase enzyme